MLFGDLDWVTGTRGWYPPTTSKQKAVDVESRLGTGSVLVLLSSRVGLIMNDPT
jgi:hypothetical protein